MSIKLVPIVVACSACATAAYSIAIPQALMTLYPTGSVGPGSGGIAPEARARLAAGERAALVATAQGALAAADTHPDDLRLQRRAAALVRELGDRGFEPAAVAHLLDRLAATPCPGLADVAATRDALGDHGGAGDIYLRASRDCGSVDAAVAAVGPLRQADRCGDALAGLRAAWPSVDLRTPGATVPVLDAVAACSDEVNLRRNLAFVPPEIVDDYFALLASRQRAADKAEAEAEEQRREQAAADAAREASWHCESECSAAESSCESSCSGASSCSQECSSVYHVCRSGCGE